MIDLLIGPPKRNRTSIRKEEFNTTFRSSEHFKESYANKNLSFIETKYEMLSMGRSKGIEPLISESQPEVLPLN